MVISIRGIGWLVFPFVGPSKILSFTAFLKVYTRKSTPISLK